MTDAPAPRAPVLVIGVGSELRADDAAGRRVAEAVAATALPHVEVRSVHQLVPELAVDIADRALVVLLDASVEVERVTVGEMAQDPAAGALSHHVSLASLLELAALFGRRPQRVVTVALPVQDLGVGMRLSPVASAAVAQAVPVVLDLCEQARAPEPVTRRT